ncbi:uncharacterized protein B0H18DRAFT_185722 [Fomitopsis serialis]|uniref:uncharacterized protein n=1 Tax=Fomitopsis serialis TaxID=139415 RepID=UPI002007A113|nr:uncharacterized protein B0H18DRAFT_185722 [Neoantrodia serialis]KAH9937050.1 hypothetical protein B0H18DRAFT_185722 [Neoantrodia serialis]
MSRRESYESDNTTKGRSRKPRCQSASQIARNVKSFELWTVHQGCEEVSYDDIPEDMGTIVHGVFNVDARLPEEWLSTSSEESKLIKKALPVEFSDFIRRARKAVPALFASQVAKEENKQLLCELQVVLSAWKRIKKMRASSRKWSEADYAANVYNVIRSPAVQKGDYRAQCSITLPQPLSISSIKTEDLRILSAKTASPDASIFVPARLVRHLSYGSNSPYKVLKSLSNGKMSSTGSIGGESSFRYQTTPCTKLPDVQGFEFASTYWEDKKHQYIEDAHRQNRMATASAVRQLHALHIRAPIFGLVWAQGTVRAHVDWWEVDPNTGQPVIRSAAYAGTNPSNRRTSGVFHEWNLEQPADILQVYLLVKNLDHWTVNGFLNCVVEDVAQLVDDVQRKVHKLAPWKRKGDLAKIVETNKNAKDLKSTPRPSFSITPSSSPPKRRSKRRAARSS